MEPFLPSRVAIPEDVLMRDLDGELVLLNLRNESYYGLDEVGARVLRLLERSGDVQETIETLLKEYDVPESTLRGDVAQLIVDLVKAGLLRIEGDTGVGNET